MNSRKFWVARFASVPLYILLFVLDTPYIHFKRPGMQGWFQAAWNNPLISSLVYSLQGWYPSLNTINFPSWSFPMKLFFYLLFPSVGLTLWKMKPKHAIFFGLGLYFVTLRIDLWFSAAGIAPDHSFEIPLMRAAEFVARHCRKQGLHQPL